MPDRTGRFVDTRATPQNLRALWDAIHAAQDGLADANDTIQQQATTIASQAQTIAAQQTQIAQALVTAGKAVSQTATGVPPAPGGGGGGGGGGGSGDSHPNHYALILQAVNELVALGEDLSGPCGAFKVIQRAVPWIQASDPAAGYLSKTTGNNCGGYAVDIVAYNDGIIFDVLQGAGDDPGSTTTANVPMWSFAGTVDPLRYRQST